MRYSYQGITRAQERTAGVVEAANEIEARLKLRALQVRPTSLEIEKKSRLPKFISTRLSKTADVPFWQKTGLSAKALSVFTRQFSSLIDSGVPVVQCLDILASQERRHYFKSVLTRIKGDIESGSGLAEAMSKHPVIFSDLFVRVVEAGELSGTLDRSLKRVGMQLEKLGRLKAKVIGALIYPCITLVVAVGVLIFMLVVVIPEISKLYADSAAQLPALTIFILQLSAWFQANWIFFFLGVFTSVFLFLYLLKVPEFRKLWDPFLLRLPLVGSLVIKSAVALFSRTMSTLIESGVPLLLSFEICVKLMSNQVVKRIIQAAASSVSEGRTIAHGLGSSTLFPPMVLHMVNIGEMTGRLDDLLAKIADIYDEEVDDAIGILTGLLQPMLIIFVGAVVAFLLLAMYLPIFQLAEKISGA